MLCPSAHVVLDWTECPTEYLLSNMLLQCPCCCDMAVSGLLFTRGPALETLTGRLAVAGVDTSPLHPDFWKAPIRSAEHTVERGWGARQDHGSVGGQIG